MAFDPASMRLIERVRLRSLVDADLDVAEPLHADDYQLVSPSGRTYSKDEYLSAVASRALEYSVFEPVSDIEVRGSEQAAIIRYIARIGFRGDGNVPPFECWHTDFYEQRTGQWQAVWSQATAIRPA